MDNKPIVLGSIYGRKVEGMSYAGLVWDKNRICPTLNSMQGGGRQPHIIVKVNDDVKNQSKQQ